LIRLWEPSHGEVLARPRPAHRPSQPGTRAYLSAGLPGADWWVAGGAAASAEDADVELDEVEQLYTERSLEHPGIRFGELSPPCTHTKYLPQADPSAESPRWEAMPAQELPGRSRNSR